MITQLILHNYRSLGKKVPVTLGPLTVLVGADGSGKGHVVDALGFLSECSREGLEMALSRRGGIDSLIRRSDEAGEPFDLSLSAFVRTERGFGYWEFRLSRDEGGNPFVAVESALWQPADQHMIHTFKVKEGQWEARLKSLEPTLARTSLALPLVADDPRFNDLVREFRNVAMFPASPKPPSAQGEGGAFSPQSLDPTSWSPPLQSALARIVRDLDPTRGPGIIAALLQSSPLTLVGLEEAERLVPPEALPALHDFFRQVSQRTQVLLTTHRPEVLELLGAGEVRVVELQDGVTDLTPFVERQREDVMRSLSAPAQSV